jgi:ADP-heptose:LPS heptosyltransferase
VREHLEKLRPLLGEVEERHTSLYVSEDERREIAARLGIELGSELVLVHPGATWRDRAWPLERWPGLIDGLRERLPKARVRVVSQVGWEREAEQVVRSSRGDVARLPALDVRSLMALVSQSALYLGNDGGILHCAVALRVPSVGIFGPTRDDMWFPYEAWGPYRAVRRPGAGHRPAGWRKRRRGPPGGFPDASVGEVLAAADSALSANRSPGTKTSPAARRATLSDDHRQTPG